MHQLNNLYKIEIKIFQQTWTLMKCSSMLSYSLWIVSNWVGGRFWFSTSGFDVGSNWSLSTKNLYLSKESLNIVMIELKTLTLSSFESSFKLCINDPQSAQ